jgi:hypothetical protein
VLDYRTNPAAVDAHVRATIDRILLLTPHLADRLRAQLGPYLGTYPDLAYAKPRTGLIGVRPQLGTSKSGSDPGFS